MMNYFKIVLVVHLVFYIQPNANGQIVANSSLLFVGESQPRPGLGINLGIIDYSMNNWVFTNKFKHAREWRPVYSLNYWQTYTMEGTFPTDWSSDNWPLNFTVDNFSKKRGYQTEIGTDGNYPTGDYVVTWQGTGNLTILGDAKNVQIVNQNKIKFRVLNATTLGIVIIVTKPNITNIDLRESFEESSTNTFGNNFTNAVKIFELLRFSPWMINRNGNSNPNANVDWSTRRPKTYYTQIGKEMVSIEYMIELGNSLSKDIWLSIPSTANDNYILNLAQYVKSNFLVNRKIYVEQSSDKNFNQNNRTLELNLVKLWKSIFGDDKRVVHVLAISFRPFFNNPSVYSDDDYKNFDAYSVSGAIANNNPYNSNSYNVSLVDTLTEDAVNNEIRQQVFKDEIDLIYLANMVAIKMPNKPLIGYDVGFRVQAATYNNRWQKTPFAQQEQNLEDLIIRAQQKPIITDIYLDFMERWYRLGGGIMVLSNLADQINRCVQPSNKCGYKSTLMSLQNPEKNPKYKAALLWLNKTKSNLPFTSADLPKIPKINCSSCVWGTCYQGKCVCFDGYSGSDCRVLKQKYLDCAPNATQFGVNVNSIPDWSTEVTFVDIHRRARQWIIQKIVYGTRWADWDQNDVQLSNDGYPKYLEIGKTIGTFLVRDVQAHFPGGSYVCLFEGDGVLEFSFDAVVTRRDAGRIELYVNYTTWMNNGIYYNILRTNPSDPIRNIRIFEARFEDTYQEFPFHPLFLELMKKYKVIRYMPWSNVNVDGETDWDKNRTTDSYYTFTLKTGVSLEKQVLLANLLGANPWFNIPYRATDDYVTKWATYVRDNLRPDVTIYIEQGNECWGSGGAHLCGNYAQAMGVKENLTIIKNQNLYSTDLQARICYHAKVGKRYSDIIKSVFGPNNRSRLKFVLGTQAAWSGPINVFFLCPGNVSQSYDVVALAPYLSATMTKPDKSLLSLDELFNTSVNQAIKDAVAQLSIISNIVNSNAPQMELATYESGPDFSSLTDSSNVALTNLSIAFHRDQRIYEALKYYLSNLTQNLNGVKLKVYNHFYSAGAYTRYGCWGLIESSDSNLEQSPKYLSYMDFIDSKKVCSWNEKPNTCKNNCSSFGLCTLTNALSIVKDRCNCYFGSSLTSNDTECTTNYIRSDKCTYKCGFKGDCLFDYLDGFYAVYTCKCYPGYYGVGCGLFNCTNECNYNGLCVDNDTCSCYRGYKGKYCDISCACNGNGYCSNTTNDCICDLGYSFTNGSCQLNCSVNSNRTECLRCPDCKFGNCIRGLCKCWAGYKLDSNNSCTMVTSSPNDGSNLGINLNGVVDWSTQFAFVDLGKQARAWIHQHIDNLNNLYIWSISENISLRNDKYPAQIDYQRQLVTLMLRDVQQRWPNGTYHVFYDGEGVIDFGFDSKIIEQSEKYKMKINVSLSSIRDNGVFMKLKKTNPKNPLRNIRVVMDGFQDIYTQIPFHPLFFEQLAKFKTIRFMPWNKEDGVVSWTDRVTPTSYSEGRGVAYEYMIELCNILKTNCWINIPYGADDDFVLQLATLVFNKIRRDVKVYVEYTNEAWNSFFNSGKYCEAMGIKLNMSSDSLIARNLYYSRRSKQIITIWKNVFKTQDNQLVLVLSSFTVMPDVSTRILAYDNAYKAHSNVMLAITGYFDCGNLSPTVIANSNISIIFAACNSSLPSAQDILIKHYNIAKNFSVYLGMYESGSSVMEPAAIYTGYETPGATDKYIAANRDPKMYTVYKNYYAMYNNYNLTENCHFGYTAIPTKYGSWSLLEYQTQNVSTAPKYQAIMDLITSSQILTNSTNKLQSASSSPALITMPMPTTTTTTKKPTTTTKSTTTTTTTTTTKSTPTTTPTTKSTITSTSTTKATITTSSKTTTKLATTTTKPTTTTPKPVAKAS